MRIVDLKKERAFIEQYIILRNSYAELLLTAPVNRENTERWLALEDLEVMGLAEENILLGVVILYLGRVGEIAFFVRDKNRGIGGKLLEIVENVARNYGLESVWSWVLEGNKIAQRVFERNGFVRLREEKREFQGHMASGTRFTKPLSSSVK